MFTIKSEFIVAFLAIVGVIFILFSIPIGAGAVTYDNDTSLEFTWTAASGDVDHYNVYVSTDEGDYVLVGTTSETAYTVTGLNGATYKVRVEAVDAAGNIGPMSDESDPVMVFLGAKIWDGGIDSNMSTAANWDGDSLPAAIDDIVIEYTGTQDTIIADASLAAVLNNINSLTIDVSAIDNQDTSLAINTDIKTTEGVTINIRGAGDLTITGAFALDVGTTLYINHAGSTGTLEFGGTGTTSVTGAITVDTSTSDAAGNITIDRSGAWAVGSTTFLTATGAGSVTMTLGADSTFTGNVTLTAGGGAGVPTLDLGSGSHTLAGSLTNVSDGVLIAGTSTLTFDGDTNKTLTSSGGSFYNLTLNKDAPSNTLTLQDALDVDGKLTLTSGILVFSNSLEHHFAGDFEIQTDGAVTKGTGTTLVFDGTTNLTDNSSGGPQDFGAIKVD